MPTLSYSDQTVAVFPAYSHSLLIVSYNCFTCASAVILDCNSSLSVLFPFC